ncbi:MAG: 2-dehydropantoate 2-reductase [Thermoplasmata archaeon]
MENDKMKIAILGAGAIGSLFGAYLSQNNEILFIGRREHIENINKYGLKVEGLTNTRVYGKGFTEYPGGADLILLTVKSYDTENAMEDIKNKLKEEFIVSLQNGIGNVDIIRKYTKNVIGAITTEAVTFISPGVIKHTGKGITKLGEIYPEHKDFAINIVKLFNQSGIKSEYSENIINEIWVKGAINSCINPLTALLEIKNGQLLDDLLKTILDELIKENEFVLKSRGIDVNLKERVMEVIEQTSENYSSMLQDIMKGKRTEIESIIGKIIEYSSKNGIDVPYLKILYYLIKEKEKLRTKIK